MNTAKENRTAAKGQGRGEMMEFYFWGHSTWLLEGHDCNERRIQCSGLEHYMSVGKIAVAVTLRK